MLLHLGPNVITFRTLLHLGQLLHLGLQQPFPVRLFLFACLHRGMPKLLLALAFCFLYLFFIFWRREVTTFFVSTLIL